MDWMGLFFEEVNRSIQASIIEALIAESYRLDTSATQSGRRRPGWSRRPTTTAPRGNTSRAITAGTCPVAGGRDRRPNCSRNSVRSTIGQACLDSRPTTVPGSTARPELTEHGEAVHKWDSDTGKQLIKDADEIKKRGNDALKNGHLELATRLYADALKKALLVENNEDQISILFSNRSYTFCKMSHFEDAVTDARECVVHRQWWFKGPWRLMSGIAGLKNFELAFKLGLELITQYHIPNDMEITIFTEVISLLPNVKEYLKLKTLPTTLDTWKGTLQNLTKAKSWQLISILFQGKDGGEPVLDTATSKSLAADMELAGLLQTCSVDEWKAWGQRLAVKLLQKSAKMTTLDPEKKYGLHAAFRVGMRTGVYELLAHLFLHYIPMGDRDRVDAAGDSLLHIACREKYSSKLSAIELLLDHKLNPIVRNKANLKPVDLLCADDPQKNKIIAIMEKKGFHRSSIISKKPEVGESKEPKDVKAETGSYVWVSSNGPASTTQGCTTLWTTGQVDDWMKENNLHIPRFTGMDGSRLYELKTMQQRTPVAFYKMLHDNLKLPFAQLLQVSRAIRRLS